MRPPLSRPFLPLWVLCFACAGVVLALVYALEATPLGEAELRISRNEAAQQAAAFLREQGVNPDTYWSTTSFIFDTQAQSYLVETTDRETLQARASADLDLAHWHVRFWQQLEPEQWEVDISTRTGRVVGFRHELPDEAPGATLTITAAQSLAQTALPDPSLRLVSRSTATKPARVDHSFVWEQPNLRTAEAQYRYMIEVQGDRIGARDEWYWLPDSWWREAAWQARRGALLATVGWSLTYVLLVLIGFTWLLEAQRDRLRRRWAWRLWIAVALVGVLVMLNSIPLELASYDVNQSLAAYLFNRFSSYADQLVTLTITIVLAGMAGEALVWEYTKGALQLGEVVTRRGFISRPVVQALLIGGLVGVGQLGAVSAFYALGSRLFGIWSPLTQLYDDTLSTPFPPLYGLALGLLPAVGEELLFRLGGITVLTRWTGRPRLAIVLTAVVWAALHATYPQRPYFIRVVELSIIGIIFGYLFVRYGVLAAMAAHFTYNASLYVPLFWGGPVWLLVAGILAAGATVVLLIPAAMRKLRGADLLPDSTLAVELPPPAPPIELPPPRPATIPSKRTMLSGTVVGGLALLLVGWNIPPTMERSSTAAGAIAAVVAATPDFVELDGLHPNARPVADWVDLDLAYVYDTLERAESTRIVEQVGQPRAWIIRWSGWDRPDWWEVELGPNNTIVAWRRSIAEDVPGATLPLTQARELAQQSLASRVDANAYELVDASSSVRSARTDHSFTWQTREPLTAEAYRRINIEIQGEHVSRYVEWMYTPPAYQRERTQQTLFSNLGSELGGWLAGGISAILTIIGLFNIRHIRLKPWLIIGAISIIGYLLLELNGLHRGQLSELPRLISALSWALRNSVLAGGELVLIGLGAAYAWRWWSITQPGLEQTFSDLRTGGAGLRAALLQMIVLLIWGLVMINLRYWPEARAGIWQTTAALDTWLPALHSGVQSLLHATRNSLLIVGAAGVLMRLVRQRWLALAILTAGISLVVVPIHSLEILPVWGITWAILGVLGAVYRFQLLSIWSGLVGLGWLMAGLRLLQSGANWYQLHGWIILAGGVIGVIGLWYIQHKSRTYYAFK